MYNIRKVTKTSDLNAERTTRCTIVFFCKLVSWQRDSIEEKTNVHYVLYIATIIIRTADNFILDILSERN